MFQLHSAWRLQDTLTGMRRIHCAICLTNKLFLSSFYFYVHTCILCDYVYMCVPVCRYASESSEEEVRSLVLKLPSVCAGNQTPDHCAISPFSQISSKHLFHCSIVIVMVNCANMWCVHVCMHTQVVPCSPKGKAKILTTSSNHRV